MTSLLFASLLLAAPPQQAWKPFRPAGALFSVSMPGKPEEKTTSTTVPLGGKVTLHAYQLSAAGHLYMVQDAVMEESVAKAAPDVLLDSVVSSFGTSFGGTKVSSGTIKFQGWPGRSMVFDKGTIRVKGITVLAGRHNYSVVFVGPKADASGPDSKRLFDSFKILSK